MSHKDSVLTYYKIFAALMGLTALTVVAAYVNLGPLGIPVALAIAITKAVLVILFFMHILHADQLTKLFLASAFVWLFILIGITLTDYVDRDWTLKHRPQNSWISKSPSHFEAKKMEIKAH